MSTQQRRSNEQLHVFTRQATILRKNLSEWDTMLRTPKGESWPTMVGRLNAAMHQTGTLDRSIDDVLEHFVYVPKQSPANPQDIPFFLSTRLAPPDEKEKLVKSRVEDEEDDEAELDVIGSAGNGGAKLAGEDAFQILTNYEKRAAQIAHDYEANMVRF